MRAKINSLHKEQRIITFHNYGSMASYTEEKFKGTATMRTENTYRASRKSDCFYGTDQAHNITDTFL
jgi:hypothetical protein